MFEIDLIHDGKPAITTLTDEHVTLLNLEYADNPPRQEALLAFVNGTDPEWTDRFGRWHMRWRRLNPASNQ